ncbi:lytic transglycosylase [Desulfospira joergensenii]|uniref:lytic transglycosylase n=1 Tax=Desulfospira joergensenii TaxID=53329 RepID=UPI0003B62F4E|nr:LysM peptidoglycan-binding domain-containing protein [Desulfospira joergensenii]
MISKNLAIITLILLLTSSCQQTHTQNARPVKCTPPPLSQTEPGTTQTCLDNTDSGQPGGTSSSISDMEGNENASPALTGNGNTPPTEDSVASVSEDQSNPDQEKIDQALDLCNHAQKMWEQGKLEEAISNLDNAYYLILELDSEVSPELYQQKEDIRFLISKRILEIYASRQIVATGPHDEIPVTMNSHVQREIKRLTGPERKYFIRALERSSRYRPLIVQELKKSGLPEEISWLPLIESGFKLRALSSARALGLWQFIPSTGYKFGLTRNYYIDERMDPEKATRAAITYLKELHNLFGDWTTALAAYNCGEGRVLRIIRGQKINYLDNFWDLYQNLPRETARYVPRFLATVHIVNNLEKYNISIDNPLSPIPYKSVEINKQLRLKDVARGSGVKLSTLKELNPELRYSLLPPETYALRIPEDKAAQFMAKLDTIKSTYSPPPVFVYHRVRRGDTLSGLARRYKTSVRAISLANNIGRTHTIVAGKVLKIPNRRRAGAVPAALTTAKPATYTVKRGDNLWIIARKFSTNTKQLMAANNLTNTNLRIGQTLLIHSKSQSIARQGSGTYRVKSGDSPFLIAKRHHMSLNRLLALNRLDKWSKIYPGQKLIIE